MLELEVQRTCQTIQHINVTLQPVIHNKVHYLVRFCTVSVSSFKDEELKV